MKTRHYVDNIRAIDLNLLGIFDAIYQERNITRAAKRLGISQPAVSGALTRLRALVDDPLFVKTTHGMEPTSRADALAEPIAMALETILNAFNQHVEFDYATAEQHFCLSMSDYSEFLMLPPLMTWLRSHAPKITLSTVPVVDETLPADMESGLVDLAIGNIPSLQTGCYRQRLVFEDFACVVRQDHPEIGDELTVKQFQAFPHVIFSPRKDENTMDEILRQQGITRNVALRIPNYLAIMAIVAETDLIGIMPIRIASRTCDLAKLKMLPCPVDYSGVTVSQHWHVRKNNNPANIWLRKLMKSLTESL